MVDKHHGTSICLDRSCKKCVGEHKYEYYDEITPATLKKTLREYLQTLFATATNCPTCGGFTKEIAFEFEDKEYFFTCYKIVGRGKTIAETDYDKFGDYCKGKGKKANQKRKNPEK